ncbi:hypothetical protein EXW96_23965 [Paenibacillus sp. JMULE4]|uniref:hypothetical protein n=1 Tax=Paenibacillus sp. JMULE4 TaxID=2518342 RepID=UPI0015756090|nr:hypothetical protein [Paenibacillus sp. JMULE4]NTZ20473.1 hypothetical protein [Paenibacillus sp. JMULE4]
MVVKRGLPEDFKQLLRQLVANGQFRIAGLVLHTYCRRIYGVDEETAARWIVAYFRREFSQQLQRHRKQTAEAR